MKTTRLAIVVVMTCAGSAVALGAAPSRPRQMGYCFDVAFHEKTNRLFVAGGDKGTLVLQVTDGKLELVSAIMDGGYHRNLKICGDRVYLADARRGLMVYDITRTPPVCTWRQQDAHGMGLDVQGNYVYLAVSGDGLQIFDISSADAPKLIGKCRTNADAWDVWVSGSYAYVADLRKGLTVVDVSQPAQPKKVALVTWDEKDPSAEIVRGEGRTVCVAAGPHGLIVLDVSNPLTPKVVSRYKSGDEGFGEGLCIKDGLIYLANGHKHNQDENGLIIVDAREPPALKVRGKCIFAGWVEGVCLADQQAFVANTGAGVRSIDVRDPDRPRLTDSFGPAQLREAGPSTPPDTGTQPRKSAEQLQNAKREVLEGRKFNDLSTASGAFLTLVAAVRDVDQRLLNQVAPVFASRKISAETCVQTFDSLARSAIVRRVEEASPTPKESDLCSIYTSRSPDGDPDQVWTFGYIQGAWRFLNCTDPSDPWESFARKLEAETREFLQQEVQEHRGKCTPGQICEEIAVVTGTLGTVETIDWDLSLQPDLAANRLKIQAAGTFRNQGPEPLDHLDFDLLAGEKFYGLHVEIARITGRVGDRETDLSFRRFPPQTPKEADQVGTRECPLVTRVSLPSALKPGQDCRLIFDYVLTCPDITQRHAYNLLWEPQEGKKEVCLIADYAWFPDLAGDLPNRTETRSNRNFFQRGSTPTWHVTLTHPADLEGMAIDGQREKTEQVGSQTVSRWKSIVGGRPQVFIGPAERIEKKGERATVVLLLPKGRYDPEFVDAVADLVLHAYSVFTDWFGPLPGKEVHIVCPSGMRGGHGAVLGMTIEASYFRTKRSERPTESGKFFVQTPVHELAHSWWPSSYGRGTKFLRESLGNFATWHLAREHFGLDLFTLELQKGILDRAQGGKPLFNPESDEEQFAYEKGPLVLDMLRQEMGNDVFFRTLREYIRRYRDGHATFIDFVSVCNEVSQRDWLPFFYQWCYAKGCPGYHLVGFESKEGKKGWETTVTIRNNGTGIVRCPLELRMADAVRREQFAIPGGREETYLYLTAQKVTGVAIDPKRTVYQEDVVEKSKSPDYLIMSAGWGRASNQELASRYDKTWLEQLTDPGLLLKIGMALYDMKRYQEALAVFEKMEEKAGASGRDRPVALIWQGHMLDLLGKRPEAVSRYEKVAAMGLNDMTRRHDQFGIAYEPSPYAKQRMDTPFTRVENKDSN